MNRLTAQGKLHASIMSAQYDDRCTIRRSGTSKGTHGGQRQGDPEILAVDVPCRATPASASEKQLAGATASETALKVAMPAWQNGAPIEIDATCEIEIAARDALPAQLLKVVAPLPNRGLRLEVVGTYRS